MEALSEATARPSNNCRRGLEGDGRTLGPPSFLFLLSGHMVRVSGFALTCASAVRYFRATALIISGICYRRKKLPTSVCSDSWG